MGKLQNTLNGNLAQREEQLDEKIEQVEENIQTLEEKLNGMVIQFRNLPNISTGMKIKSALNNLPPEIATRVFLGKTFDREEIYKKDTKDVDWLRLATRAINALDDDTASSYPFVGSKKDLIEKFKSIRQQYVANLQTAIGELNDFCGSQVRDYDKANDLMQDKWYLPELEALMKQMLEASQEYDCIASKGLGMEAVRTEHNIGKNPEDIELSSKKFLLRTTINSLFYTDPTAKLEGINGKFNGSLLLNLGTDNEILTPEIDFSGNSLLHKMIDQRNSQTYEAMKKNYMDGVRVACKDLGCRPEQLGFDLRGVVRPSSKGESSISISGIRKVIQERFALQKPTEGGR